MEIPDNLMIDTSDNAAMIGVDVLTPKQFGVSKNAKSSDDSESRVTCKPCDKSFESDLAFITHEIEMHSISSWSEEVDTEEKIDIEYVKRILERKENGIVMEKWKQKVVD